jgi:DNA-binding transcriptional ArsR family regulator
MSNGNDYWTLLTNHGAVLLHVAEHPDDTILEIAELLGLRERAVAAIISDLRHRGYVSIERQGRHNHYSVNEEMALRRPAHQHLTVRSLLAGLRDARDSVETSHAARAESQRMRSFFGT